MYERGDAIRYSAPNEYESTEEYTEGDVVPIQVINSRKLTSLVKPVVEIGQRDVVKSRNDSLPAKKSRYRMIRRQPAKIFNCPDCRKTFKHPSKIAEHLRVHTGEKPYRCELCGVGFTQGNPLKVHMRMHRGERPYVCGYCDRSFPTSSQKKSHEKTHAKQQLGSSFYLCPVGECKARIAHRDAMAAHIQQNHPEIGEVVEECDEKRLLISTVEDLIEKVEDPDDVREETAWEDPQIYYSDVVMEEVDGPTVASIDGDAQEDVLNVDCPVSSCISSELTVQPVMNLPISVSVDGEEVEHIFVGNEEIIGDGEGEGPIYNFVNSEDNFYSEEDGTVVVMEGSSCDEILQANGEIAVHNGSLVHQPLTLVDGAQCVYVDANSDALKPTVEEEVETTGGPYVEVVDEAEYGGYVSVDHAPQPPAVFTRKRRFKRMEQGLLAGTHHLEVESVGSEDGACGQSGERRAITADPRPPRKGRRRVADDVEDYRIEVDPAIFEMAAPTKRHREAAERLLYAEEYIVRPARNLDWIIDAVARGDNIDDASPHHRRKPQVHRCEYCGRIDKYPSKIKAHMRTHTGEKPFVCDICGMRFAQRTPMRMHVRRHLNQKPYVCDVDGCGERFINGSLLNAHQNARHFERKRFACLRGCGRSFAQARNQRKHEANCTYGTDRGYLRDDDDLTFPSNSRTKLDESVSSMSSSYSSDVSIKLESGVNELSGQQNAVLTGECQVDVHSNDDELVGVADDHHALVDEGHFLRSDGDQKLLSTNHQASYEIRMSADAELRPSSRAVLGVADQDVVGQGCKPRGIAFGDTKQLVNTEFTVISNPCMDTMEEVTEPSKISFPNTW